MEKISPLLDRANKELKTGSRKSKIAAGQSKSVQSVSAGTVREREAGYDGPNSGQSSSLDHVDAINQVFAEFEFAYHNQFHKAFASHESLVIAKKYWLSSLDTYTPRQIVLAGKRVISTQDYLPSIAAFIRACEQGQDLFGLPSTHEAYIQACAAPSPKIDFGWSHEAVYLAGKAAGWFLLANESEAMALPIFRYHYEILCRRVVTGETLEVATPVAIPEKTQTKLSPAEKKSRMAKLRAQLGL
ncbi:MAG: hypothetical protein ACI95C_000146 [Pseudohongiellaceae bacterium]|jgi:hypothetical protein